MSTILIITSNVRPFSCPIICTDIYYRPQRSWGKVIFSQACVILFTGGDLPQCMLGYHTPPGPGTPQTRHPPDHTPPQTMHPRPDAGHAGRYGQCAGGMHPIGMQSCSQCYCFH